MSCENVKMTQDDRHFKLEKIENVPISSWFLENLVKYVIMGLDFKYNIKFNIFASLSGEYVKNNTILPPFYALKSKFSIRLIFML